MPLEEDLAAALGDLEVRGRRRSREGVPPASLLDACSNDYLGYAAESVSRETMEGVAAGAGASRLIHGTRAEHEALELEASEWVRASGALLFSSGYAANLGLLAAVGREGVEIFSDRLNHASIIDGCRLSRAAITVYDHCDLRDLERALRGSRARTKLVVTESYFSMDADGPDLGCLAALAAAHGADLVVDEAHALGAQGPSGAGLCAAARVSPAALVGTLGKAVGAQGAFVAGSRALLDWLWNSARSLVFSTAISPITARVALAAVRRARADDERRSRLERSAERVRAALDAAGHPAPSASWGPIVPVVVGDADRALRLAASLRRHGILAQAIRPPTVPEGTARVRITVKATFSDLEVTRLCDAIMLSLREL